MKAPEIPEPFFCPYCAGNSPDPGKGQGEVSLVTEPFHIPLKTISQP